MAALGVGRTPKELAIRRHPDHHGRPTDANLVRLPKALLAADGLGELALRVGVALKEVPVAPPLDVHRGATLAELAVAHLLYTIYNSLASHFLSEYPQR